MTSSCFYSTLIALFRFLPFEYIRIPSSNRLILAFGFFGMSFVNTRYGDGEGHDPYRTPALIGWLFESFSPCTLNILFLINDFISFDSMGEVLI